MTGRHEWDEADESPSWVDAVSQARNAEDRIVQALRREGLIRSRGARTVQLWRSLALAATIVAAFGVGTQLGRDDRSVPPAERNHGQEAPGAAFHLVHPLDQENPPAVKPPVEAFNPPVRESSPAFHLPDPLDGAEPEEYAPLYVKDVQLAVR